MLARYELTIKFNIVQQLPEITDILDIHELGALACQSMADFLTDYKACLTYEIVSGKVDAD